MDRLILVLLVGILGKLMWSGKERSDSLKKEIVSFLICTFETQEAAEEI